MSAAAAAASASAPSWSAAIPVTRPATAADLAALRARFGVTLPAKLEELLLEHGGDQIEPATFWAQNVQSGAWRRERMGPLYPAALPEPAAAEGDEDDEGQYLSYNLTVVNEMFLDDLAEADDDVDAPAVSRGKGRNASSSKAAEAAAAASSSAKPSKPSVPFFAFSEAADTGRLLVIDTRSQYVMLLDVTGKKGPWIAGENFDDFFKRLTSGTQDAAHEADAEEQEEQQEEVDDDEEMGEDDEEGEEDGEDEDLFCCDGCMDELPASATRFHCNSCKNYDLCTKCMAKNEKKQKAAASASSSSAAPKKKTGRAAPTEDAEHPLSHTFTKVSGAADDEAEEEEEKTSSK